MSSLPIPTSILPYIAYLPVFLIIITGALLIASPHFPDSEVSEQRNKEAYYALTILGVFITVPGLIWLILIIQGLNVKIKPIEEGMFEYRPGLGANMPSYEAKPLVSLDHY